MYTEFVKSTLRYNSNSWAPTKANMEKADACNRKHLRKIMGICWPKRISNVDLYKKASCEPISSFITRSRLKVLQEVVIMDENSPAYASLVFVLENFRKFEARRSRPRMNLLSMLQNELKSYDIKLETIKDIYDIQQWLTGGNSL